MPQREERRGPAPSRASPGCVGFFAQTPQTVITMCLRRFCVSQNPEEQPPGQQGSEAQPAPDRASELSSCGPSPTPGFSLALLLAQRWHLWDHRLLLRVHKPTDLIIQRPRWLPPSCFAPCFLLNPNQSFVSLSRPGIPSHRGVAGAGLRRPKTLPFHKLRHGLRCRTCSLGISRASIPSHLLPHCPCLRAHAVCC